MIRALSSEHKHPVKLLEAIRRMKEFNPQISAVKKAWDEVIEHSDSSFIASDQFRVIIYREGIYYNSYNNFGIKVMVKYPPNSLIRQKLQTIIESYYQKFPQNEEEAKQVNQK